MLGFASWSIHPEFLVLGSDARSKLVRFSVTRKSRLDYPDVSAGIDLGVHFPAQRAAQHMVRISIGLLQCLGAKADRGT